MTSALVTIDNSTEVAPIFQVEIARADDRRQQATSESTKRNYSAEWMRWTSYCVERGLEAMPANPVVVAVYVNKLFDDGLSVSTIDLARASIIAAHKAAGVAFDAENARLAEVMKGIRRDAGKKRQKQAAAMDVADLQAFLALDDAGSMQIARDKAMIALGFGHALRGPSELLELDYAERGQGKGSLEIARHGLVIHLSCSKTSDDAEALTVDSDAIKGAVARWVALSGIKAGEPLFQSFKRNGKPTGRRLAIDGLTMAIRARVADAMVAGGQGREAAQIAAESYSTHSLRRGAATAMARNGATPLEIAGITRHKSLAMVQRYCDAGGQKYAPMRKLGL